MVGHGGPGGRFFPADRGALGHHEPVEPAPDRLGQGSYAEDLGIDAVPGRRVLHLGGFSRVVLRLHGIPSKGEMI